MRARALWPIPRRRQRSVSMDQRQSHTIGSKLRMLSDRAGMPLSLDVSVGAAIDADGITHMRPTTARPVIRLFAADGSGHTLIYGPLTIWPTSQIEVSTLEQPSGSVDAAAVEQAKE